METSRKWYSYVHLRDRECPVPWALGVAAELGVEGPLGAVVVGMSGGSSHPLPVSGEGGLGSVLLGLWGIPTLGGLAELCLFQAQGACGAGLHSRPAYLWDCCPPCPLPLPCTVQAARMKQHSVTKNTAKLDRETEELHHDRCKPLEVGSKAIQQGRQGQGLDERGTWPR